MIVVMILRLFCHNFRTKALRFNHLFLKVTNEKLPSYLLIISILCRAASVVDLFLILSFFNAVDSQEYFRIEKTSTWLVIFTVDAHKNINNLKIISNNF